MFNTVWYEWMEEDIFLNIAEANVAIEKIEDDLGDQYTMRILPLFYHSWNGYCTHHGDQWGYYRIYFYAPNLPFILYYQFDYCYDPGLQDQEYDYIHILQHNDRFCRFIFD